MDDVPAMIVEQIGQIIPMDKETAEQLTNSATKIVGVSGTGGKVMDF